MDFSNEDLKKLISDKFKGYEVVPCYSSDIVWEYESTRKIELHHCVEATDYIIAYYDIDLKKFRGRLFSENFETELEAVKDFHDRVLKLVAEKETEQKKQSELDEGGKIMDKEKIVSQLQHKMQKTYIHAEVLEYYNTLALKVEGEVIAWFSNWSPDDYIMECGPKLTKWALNNDILLNFYKEGRKLLKKPIKKYRIRVLKGKPTVGDHSYLNVNYRLNLVSFENGEDFEEWRASFTKKEIEELKARDDIAIDWSKAELEEVDDDE